MSASWGVEMRGDRRCLLCCSCQVCTAKTPLSSAARLVKLSTAGKGSAGAYSDWPHGTSKVPPYSAERGVSAITNRRLGLMRSALAGVQWDHMRSEYSKHGTSAASTERYAEALYRTMLTQ